MYKINVSTLILSLLLGFVSSQALAEKADKFKETKVSGIAGAYDASKNIITFEKIEVTRGTLYIRGEKGTDISIPTSKEHPEGGGTTVLLGTPANPVFFRQKRDGGEELWIEGTAQRVEYNKASDVVTFHGAAVIRFLDHQKETRKLEGEFFSYDSPNDFLNLANSSTGKSTQNGGRVTFTQQPEKAKTETKTSKP
ncbi:LptA/OstA family protein [Undibacterium cyanobacteriorum]|uniref:LptA/OstA family protein n=1 Tax=Undibacterium cyanobacteriorum TaxID=3073561 RepID=A0ABY9RJ53_9BURK|nr:LptA/OstA family protein [Undibacterium sp. 20NA77.5]WMW81254.1 LptA/OstA family protein [Undibacterium sp. 20NA77.5]